MPKKTLKTLHADEPRTLKFTSRVVCLTLDDPDATDLAFVDLPGLIQNESEGAIQLVQKLVTSHIRRPNSLILVAMPMTDDIENQMAVRLAREADPSGDRTIGIITKPDLLGPGAVESLARWKDIVLGKTHILRHGYYVVRLPDDTDRNKGMENSKARSQETKFFQKMPWGDPSMPQGRFGIAHLVEDLSRLLVERIEKALPALKEQVEQLLESCVRDIDALPPGLSQEPQVEVLLRVSKFCTGVSEMIEAKVTKEFVQRNRDSYRSFKLAIKDTGPDFRPYSKSWRLGRPAFSCEEPDDDDEAMLSDDDEEPVLADDASLRRSSPIYRDLADSPRKCEGDECLSISPIAVSYPGPSAPSPSGPMAVEVELPSSSTGTGPLSLEDIRKAITRSMGWELPGHVPYEATRSLILRHVKLWDGPTMQYFERCFTTLEHAMEHLEEEHFFQFKHLHHHVQNVCNTQLRELKAAALVSVIDLLKRENAPVFTQNTHYFRAQCTSWQRAYTEKFKAAGGSCKYDSTCKCRIPSQSRHYESPCVRPVDAKRQEELTVMGNVRAYFQVAFKRFIDAVPLAIEHVLNRGMANSLPGALMQSLLESQDSAARMKDLVAESPELEKKRKDLASRKERLETIRKLLNAFGHT
ncbi:hypothetical protein ONZ45_g3813 [Pleurotus djamor]|nr:hypothetical protein ONZ45_g3813 [Pleurotus djamor]